MSVGRAAAGCSAAVLAALALSACGGSAEAPNASGARGSGEVTELRSLEPLKAAFAADRGRARLVLLVSPT